MFLDIEHDIKFTYDDFISESWVELRIEPQSNSHQSVYSFFLAVGPRTKVARFLDWSGNAVRHFSIAQFHQQIEVRARSVVETKTVQNFLESIGEPLTPRDELGMLLDFLPFDGPITKSAALVNMFESIKLDKSQPLGLQVQKIGKFVHKNIAYKPNLTTYDSTIDDALAHGAGVCQDMAQIMIGLLRLAEIPARYVNGYLHVDSEISETSESHAWVEFYSQEFGWVGYDPTGGIQPSERHVVVATGRNYDEVPPNRGVYRGSANESLVASVRTRETDSPAFTAFREEVQEIELPVYAETPNRRRFGVPEDQIDQTSQQQQQ